MSVIAGYIQEITFNHPTVGSGVLFTIQDSDATIDTGGIRSADEMGGVDTGGRMIDQKSLNRWMVSCEISNSVNATQEMEKLVAIAASSEEADWTFSHISGTIYRGKGQVVGDIAAVLSTAKMPIKFSGGGALARI
jgi:hypothetical protein